jgi:hypothetical protein
MPNSESHLSAPVDDKSSGIVVCTFCIMKKIP